MRCRRPDGRSRGDGGRACGRDPPQEQPDRAACVQPSPPSGPGLSSRQASWLAWVHGRGGFGTGPAPASRAEFWPGGAPCQRWARPGAAGPTTGGGDDLLCCRGPPRIDTAQALCGPCEQIAGQTSDARSLRLSRAWLGCVSVLQQACAAHAQSRVMPAGWNGGLCAWLCRLADLADGP